MNEPGCCSIKSHFQKQAVGQIWPLGRNLLTIVVEHVNFLHVLCLTKMIEPHFLLSIVIYYMWLYII